MTTSHPKWTSTDRLVENNHFLSDYSLYRLVFYIPFSFFVEHYCFRAYCVIIFIFGAKFYSVTLRYYMYLPFTVHFLYRPFHLIFLGYRSWSQCFGFNSEPRVSTFSLSPPSSLEDGGKRFMGLTCSFPLEIYFAVTGFLHSSSMSFLPHSP